MKNFSRLRACLGLRLAPSRRLFPLAVLASVCVLGSSASAQEATGPRIVVQGASVSPTPSPEDYRPKLNHIMREVEGTQITVTKKATVIKLDLQPPIQNNNEQELFTKAPGFLVTEQQNPGQFNFSYRGLG
ncbi:MAG TPA: hypothetical protein VK474_12565, partial [Chthoniobacterales bacterium]|nr:hypothetical protein [Chthoniobacterales bacterium]